MQIMLLFIYTLYTVIDHCPKLPIYTFRRPEIIRL